MSYYVYILHSPSADKYYVGSCMDVIIRLAQHNNGRNTSTKFGTPWRVVYTEQVGSQPEARRRELEIKKKKSRKYIEWLIGSKG